MEHHERRPGRGLFGQPRQVVHQVTAYQQWRVGRRDRRRGAQPVPAVPVLRPDQRLQPGHVGRVGDVERVQVQPGPPHHLRTPLRRLGAGQVTVEQRLAVADPPIAVAVGVPVRVEAQPGGGADLQQRQRLRQRGEHRQQSRAASRLVRLRGPHPHLRRHVRPVPHHVRAERRRVVHRPAAQPHHPEQQVRLTLGRRQRVEQGEQLRVTGDHPRQPLVRRGHAARLTLGEDPIDVCRAHPPSIPARARDGL